MLSEEQSNPSEYFLQVAFYFSDDAISAWQGETINRLKVSQKNIAFNRFVNWKRQENEIAVFTLYANTYFSIPIQFDCIFDFTHPEVFYQGRFAVTQSIYEGWMPVDSIAQGHKHICILTFEEKVPELIKKLHYETNKHSKWKGNTQLLGLCNFKNLKAIVERIRLEE
ncbi:MAG: hypothetical protein CFE21_01060 [Bacteroidetes bacterium B1(2017)]|nr:MAG: hypothetical protein CFE21_01060 [Bacteroidetes bacterium B1(2017)]